MNIEVLPVLTLLKSSHCIASNIITCCLFKTCIHCYISRTRDVRGCYPSCDNIYRARLPLITTPKQLFHDKFKL